jgi:hypothetical protein
MRKLLSTTIAACFLLAFPGGVAAHHVPGASYSGAHTNLTTAGEEGSISFSLTRDLCAVAKKKVKRLKRQVKNADRPSKKLREKLRDAKRTKRFECEGTVHSDTSLTPTGTYIRTFVIGGPVTGEQSLFHGPCTILGPGPHPLNLEFPPRVTADRYGNHGLQYEFGPDELAEIEEGDLFGVFRPSPQPVIGHINLSYLLSSFAGSLPNFCEASLSWYAIKG